MSMVQPIGRREVTIKLGHHKPNQLPDGFLLRNDTSGRSVDRISRSQAQNALKSLNHNGSGRINVQELQQHLADANCQLDQARVKQFIASHEVAQDGTVDLQQLSNLPTPTVVKKFHTSDMSAALLLRPALYD
ncbi:uncharacterized protein DEA37_0002481 [Paragonimus westermani]|uniref:EF-hand domain-containing protein n=1 Tax=Paragonimus westermani TaxID=34504 RepID=A0A5J4NKI3_9TREM|nr:uncharacterized protein DEA37_0002481 [Paragonimus westermani]